MGFIANMINQGRDLASGMASRNLQQAQPQTAYDPNRFNASGSGPAPGSLNFGAMTGGAQMAPGSGQGPLVPGLTQGPPGTGGVVGQSPNVATDGPGSWGSAGAQPAGPSMTGQLTGGGPGELFYQQNQGAFTTPGMGERYSADVMNRYGGGNTPGVSNNAQSQYSSFLQNQPNLSQDLNPYYNNAIRRGNEDIRQNMASKGAYGSSTADDQTREMVTNLRAEQANREGQYGLQRAGELRSWQQTGGALAQGADSSSQAQSQNQMNWTNTLGSIANAGQGAEQNRLGAGFGMAAGSQGLGENRLQNQFNNQLAMGDRMAGLMGNTYGQMLGQDADFMGNTIGLATGLGAEALNQDYRNTERFMSDMERTQAMAGGGKGKGK